MSTTDICLNTICEQRKRQILFNFPPLRYNPISPYVENPNITPVKLDMRRKAEILQYNANKSNTKTNKYTKAEKWSLLVNGKNQPKSYNNITLTEVRYIPSTIASDEYAIVNGNPQIFDSSIKYSSIPVYNDIIVEYPDTYERVIDNTTGNITYNIIPGTIPFCNTDMIPTPTSSSDVPGSIINLVRDVSIPLYNYATNLNTLALTNEENNTKYRYIINKNIEFTNNEENNLFSLNIINNDDEYRNTFGFDVPITINFKDTRNPNIPTNQDISWNNININVSDINLNVYYNNSSVSIGTFNINNADVSNVSYDVSLNTYSGQLYLGILKVSNLQLYTQPGYVYDIKFKFTINTSYETDSLSNNINYTEYFNNFNTIIIANPTNIDTFSNNCKINSNPSTKPNNGFTLYGY